MIATPFAPGTTLVPALHPELQQLIDRGILSRAASNDTLDPRDGAEAFAAELARVVGRGGVSQHQADTLSRLLGVRAA